MRLEADEYARLEAEAARLGIGPEALARDYVRAGLWDGETEAQRKRRIGLEAVDRLAKLTADLPPIDAVELMRESREELEQRPFGQ